jgi:hypothetical protein
MDKRRTRSPEKRYLGFFARIEDESDVALLDKLVRNLHGSSNRFLARVHQLNSIFAIFRVSDHDKALVLKSRCL